jgi:hypothetical protein
MPISRDYLKVYRDYDGTITYTWLNMDGTTSTCKFKLYADGTVFHNTSDLNRVKKIFTKLGLETSSLDQYDYSWKIYDMFSHADVNALFLCGLSFKEVNFIFKICELQEKIIDFEREYYEKYISY